MKTYGFLVLPIERLLINWVNNSLIMITAIKITKGGALWTNSNAFPKTSNNFETLLKKKSKKTKKKYIILIYLCGISNGKTSTK